MKGNESKYTYIYIYIYIYIYSYDNYQKIEIKTNQRISKVNISVCNDLKYNKLKNLFDKGTLFTLDM